METIMRSVASILRSVPRLLSITGVFFLAVIAAVLALTTSPNGVATNKRDGDSVTVLGIVGNHAPNESAYVLLGLCGRDAEPLFVLANGESPSSAALTVCVGRKSTTDTGRPILLENQHWAIPLALAHFPMLQSMISLSATQLSWITSFAAVLFVIVVARKSARLVSAAFLVMTSLMAGVTISRAAIDHGLITARMLPFATICALMVACTLGASRLKR